MKSTIESAYSPAEEVANAVIHGVGLLLAIAGLAVLVGFAALRGGSAQIVGVSVFGATLVFQYATSTLYHAIPNPRAKPVLRAFDHAAIYFLIAGTYTPFTLVNLRGVWGWSLFGMIWGLAALGLVLRFTAMRSKRRLRVAVYLAMGWVVLVAAKPLIEATKPAGLVLLVAGGLFYTVGVIFYLQKQRRYSHAVWHAFVLAGSVSHYFAVLLYVAPAG